MKYAGSTSRIGRGVGATAPLMLALGNARRPPQNDAMTSPAASCSITKPNAAEWDAFVSKQDRAHLLQLSRWGALKSQFGWRARIVALAINGEIVAGAMTLMKSLPLGIGSMAYVPMGAYARDDALYPALWPAIGSETGAAFLKLEPGFFPDDRAPDFGSMGFVPSPQTIQPARTIQIDISGAEDAILQRMNQGTRRKIRKSLGSELQIRQGGRAELADFYALLRQTGQRGNFGVHSYDYYERVCDLFLPDHGALLMARLGGKPLAAIMVFALGDRAWYFYGASAREQGKVYASHGLQWAAINWARARGCRSYDMWGVPDHDQATLEANFKRRRDGLWGVYGFKRGFGGQLRRSAGTWDLAYNPLLYRAYLAALKLKRD